MRTRSDDGTFHRVASNAAVAVIAVCVISAIGSAATAQQGGDTPDSAPSADPSEPPPGLPPENWPTSPHRGVIDGWTGKPIPCRCRFNGQSYQLGTIACMTTHVGTVLTRCDIVGNNTSWMPSKQPCTPPAGT
jgi:hypothetical protein